MGRYPHEFSGGQRQRIAVARAIALMPRLVILDEPLSALDVSIQAGVINLLERLKVVLGLSYLFVAHDLSVVRNVADRVAAIDLGKIVETGSVDQVFEEPAHPYTQALLSAIPLPHLGQGAAVPADILQSDLPSPANPPSGCRFRTRCQLFATLDEERRRACIERQPPLVGSGALGDDHIAACHYPRVIDVF